MTVVGVILVLAGMIVVGLLAFADPVLLSRFERLDESGPVGR